MLEILGITSWSSALLALLSGSALGFVFGFVPGLGGRVGLVLSLPLAALFSPYEAAIFLFSMHSVVNTSGAIPNIAFGIPSSAPDLATVIDGYPLAKMGRAGEALGASLSASAIGGVLGATAFLLAIPIARPLVTSFGPPEFLLLAIFGLTMVASLSREGLLPGLVVSVLGMIVSIVGLDLRTGDPRLTFGSLDLWDGIGLPALVCGLFVVPEMLSLTALDRSSHERATATTIGDVFRGMFVTLSHMRVVLRSTLYGIVIGLTPSLGSSISVWMSYDYAARTTKSEIPFGKGAIAGVIAPEAANNSKEGGAMIPTLFFGIPGSSSMAIMMGALAFVGVAVGPDLLTTRVSLSYSLAAAVFLANIIVVPLFFLVIPSLVRLSALRREAIVPFAIVASVTAAIIDEPRAITIILLAVGSLIGLGLKLANWPRAPFILGYVIGDLAEASYFQTAQLYGWSALSRPITLILAVFVVGWLVYTVRTQTVMRITGPRVPNILLSAGLAAFFVAVVIVSYATISGVGSLAPIALSVFATLLCLIMIAAAIKAGEVEKPEAIRHLFAFGLFLLLTPFVGLIVAGIGFNLAVLLAVGVRLRNAIVAALIFGGAQFLLLSAVFDLVIEKEIVGRMLWTMMGF